jgi:hypothetical protein
MTIWSLPIMEALIGSLVIAWTVHAVLLVWFQGSIFAGWRSWLEARRDLHWWAKLLTCSLCSSVWLTFFLVVFLILPWYLETHEPCEAFLLPFWWGGGLCIARAINQGYTVNPAEE